MHICMRYLSLQGYQAILTPQTIPGAILKALQMMMDFQSMEFGNLRAHMMHGMRMVTQILWGLFFARYNPSIYEFLLGTGPLNLSKHYSEIGVSNYDAIRNDTKNFALETFLLPHSSLLNMLLYFGLIGVLVISIYIFRIITKRKNMACSSYCPIICTIFSIKKNKN